MGKFGKIWIGTLIVTMVWSIGSCSYEGSSGPGDVEGGWFNMHGRQSALDAQGILAQEALDLYNLVLWLEVGLFIAVGGALALAIWKFRMKKDDDPNFIPSQSHGHPLIEVGLIAGSAAILVVIAIPTFAGIINKETIPEGDDVLEINVTGYRWWFGFEYPEEGIYTANELAFPEGRVVKLNLRTDDVIHSFWLPKLAGKTDLMPGQNNMMWFKADPVGETVEYYGQCAEYCGSSHAYMLFRAMAMPEAEYDAWVEKQRSQTVKTDGTYAPVSVPASGSSALVEKGSQLFLNHCSRCHSVDPTIQTNGPNLAHFASRSAIAAGWLENDWESPTSNPNLHQWILDPESVKPGSYMWSGFIQADGRSVLMEGLNNANLTSDDVDALVAYLYTLQ